MIAFLINELDIRGGTHKQFLKLLEYTSLRTDDFIIITKCVDFNKTYPDFKKFKSKVKIFNEVKATPNSSVFRKYRLLKENKIRLSQLLEGIDSVNIHDCGFERYFPVLKNKYTVWQVNDLPGCFGVGCAKSRKETWKTILLRHLYKHYSKYVTRFTVNVSKNRDRIRAAFHRDADVLYCGIEPIGITKDSPVSVANFKNNKLHLLSSGVFFPYRNYETQIDIVDNLKKQGIDVHLNIIGATDRHENYSSYIKKLISERGLSDNITICGQVDESEFRRLHSMADIFIFINIDQSWGLAVFEAMSCGIPVIVSESVGATEILSNGKNAIFVPPLDAALISEKIVELMHNTDKYEELCTESQKFHTNYTWDNTYSSKIYNILTK